MNGARGPDDGRTAMPLHERDTIRGQINDSLFASK